MDVLISPDRTKREGVEAVSITLADGHRWGLALPSLRLRPQVSEGVDSLGRPASKIRLVTVLGYPLEIRRLIDDLQSACDQEEPERQYENLIRLTVALLRRAHDIDLATAASLLEMGVDDLPRIVEAVLSAVTGECLVDRFVEKERGQ